MKQCEHVEVGGLRERVGELQLRTDMLDLDDAEGDGIANEVCATQTAEDALPALAVAREQMRCWLRCDACARWRLVDRRSLPAVDPAAFAKPKCGTEDAPDWSNWFAGASQRYAACRAARALRLAQQGRGGDALDLEQAAVQCAGAASVEREIRGAESLTVTPADGGGDAESSGSQSRLDTSECGSRAAFEWCSGRLRRCVAEPGLSQWRPAW